MTWTSAAQAGGSTQPPPNVAAFQTAAQVNAAIAAATASLAPQSSLPTPAQIAAAAPVQTVNGLTGNPIIPAYQRQVSAAMPVSTADGTLTWTFPSAFTNPPTCFYSLSAASTTYTFDYPEVTAISRTAVSLLVTAHPKSLTIASLTLPIVLQLTPSGPPAGTTITFSCLAPL